MQKLSTKCRKRGSQIGKFLRRVGYRAAERIQVKLRKDLKFVKLNEDDSSKSE